MERRVSAEGQVVDDAGEPPSTCEKIIAEVRKMYEEVGYYPVMKAKPFVTAWKAALHTSGFRP